MQARSAEIDVIGVPLDHGAGRRGVGMGPGAMRIAGVSAKLERLGYQVREKGDLAIGAPETETEGSKGLRFLGTIQQTCQTLCDSVADILSSGGFPLVLGGDHSIAIGTISGVAKDLADRNGGAPAQSKLGVLWFDAHGDINNEKSSPSGNIHGMPVACLLGDGPDELTSIAYAGPKMDPGRVVQIGLRDIDEREKELLKASGIHTYTMADIDRHGIHRIINDALQIVTDGTESLHVSFDIDSVDPRIAPGTGTPKLGGLTFREAHYCLEAVAETGRMTSMEMVEVNPVLDDRNQTAELAVGLIASAMGKRIL